MSHDELNNGLKRKRERQWHSSFKREDVVVDREEKRREVKAGIVWAVYFSARQDLGGQIFPQFKQHTGRAPTHTTLLWSWSIVRSRSHHRRLRSFRQLSAGLPISSSGVRSGRGKPSFASPELQRTLLCIQRKKTRGGSMGLEVVASSCLVQPIFPRCTVALIYGLHHSPSFLGECSHPKTGRR